MLRDPDVIRELSGLSLLVIGLGATAAGFIWLFLAGLAPVAMTGLGLIAVGLGWTLAHYERTGATPPDDVDG